MAPFIECFLSTLSVWAMTAPVREDASDAALVMALAAAATAESVGAPPAGGPSQLAPVMCRACISRAHVLRAGSVVGHKLTAGMSPCSDVATNHSHLTTC